MVNNISACIVQLDCIVGNIEYNFNKIVESYNQAVEHNIDLIVFPRFSITGYMTKKYLNNELLFPEELFTACKEKINILSNIVINTKTAIIIDAIDGKICSDTNSIILTENIFYIKDGSITNLTNNANNIIEHDIIFELNSTTKCYLYLRSDFENELADKLNKHSPQLTLVMNKTPYKKDHNNTLQLIKQLAIKYKTSIIYSNLVGIYDENVFIGKSFITNDNKTYVLPALEATKIVNISNFNNSLNTDNNTWSEVYTALIIGLRSYIHKNGFKSVVLGLSGGIDSALVATLAADALGANNVYTVMLPTKYTSQYSITDAEELAYNLEIDHTIFNIEDLVTAKKNKLIASFLSDFTGTTEENLQARIRGIVLMALSNEFNRLLLATGNRSEICVGYATLYGDMCGGFDPIKYLYKTEVYELSNWRNQNIPGISLLKKANVIPQNIINKAPTAELRYNQQDSDSLPPYNILDTILKLLVDQKQSFTQIINQGFDQKTLEKVADLIKKSAFKRHQATLGINVLR